MVQTDELANMAHHQFELSSGRHIGVSILGEPLATRLVLLCLPTACAGPFDPDPIVTVAAGIKVIEIDRPGYGASDPLPDDIAPTVEQFADDMAEYLQRVEIVASDTSGERFGTVAIIGWSFGGIVAAAFAARHPDLVDRLVLVATPRPEQLQHGERYSAIAELRKHGVERTRASLKASLDDDGHPSLLTIGIDGDDPDLAPLGMRGRVERMIDAGWMQQSSGIASDRLAVRANDWVDAVSAASGETLLVYGARDDLATSKDADWFEHRLGHSTRVEAVGSGHLVIATEWPRITSFVAADEKAIP